jgi:dipeptidyl aminopeptidase/acylaminoacyl peptidase
MRHLFALLALLVAAIAAPAWAAPLEAYGRLPTIENAALSPSGQLVGLITTDGDQRIVSVRNVADGKVLVSAPAGGTKIRDIDWVGDGHLLVVSSTTQTAPRVGVTRSEWFLAYLLDVGQKRVRPLLGDVDGLNVLAGDPSVRWVGGKPELYLRGLQVKGDGGHVALFRVDLARGTSELVQVGDLYTDDWVLAPDGSPVAESMYDGKDGVWALKVRAGGGWKQVKTVKSMHDTPWVVGFGRDTRTLVVAEPGADGLTWRELSLADASWGEARPASEEQGAIRDPLDGHMIGLHELAGDTSRYTFFDPADEKLWKSVASAFPGDRVTLISWSNDRRKILVHVDSATDGPDFAIVDLDAKSAKWLGGAYDALKPADISPVRPISYKAADGLALTGYLTTPQGKAPKNLPLIVFAHGGPASRDVPGFNWWAQAMASRGYAVLQVNFRGSDGFGRKFLEAGYGEWGGKMQTDLSDGVRWLAAQGIVDPQRVCIIGGSYGGYAALAGATLERGVYRCAVSVAGVSDLKKQVQYSQSKGGQPTLRYWKRFMGADDLKDQILIDRSPALQAARAEIPVLLIHGKDDTVVPYEQSRLMDDAMRRAGKPVELVTLPGEDHWLTGGKTRLAMLKAAVAFIERYNPPN